MARRTKCIMAVELAFGKAEKAVLDFFAAEKLSIYSTVFCLSAMMMCTLAS